MKKQYLHLSAYACEECKGPVVSGSLAVRENEISKETEMRRVGAICLACGHRQSKVVGLDTVRKFAPVEWGSVDIFGEFHRAVAARGNE
jgi:hypothetical protein